MTADEAVSMLRRIYEQWNRDGFVSAELMREAGRLLAGLNA